MATSVSDMDKIIQDILEEYGHEVESANVNVVQDVSKECVKTLKATSPRKNGSYARTWTYTTNASTGRYGAIIYNNKNYRLTHLLENGHDLVSPSGKLYGRTRAIPHIKPAEEKAVTEYGEKLKRAINAIK